ncbi:MULTISPECIES: hypothetical protein [unclassified Pseudoalteromonas]|uniref:hypothetical protein n=1 Tax=unclassified Pseudoalteromonas TaxID=194690 RepID=UPI003014E1F2
MHKHIKLLAIVMTLLAANTSYADISVGSGYQYGGMVGVKYAHVSENHVTFASLGVVGGAVGYQYALSTDKKHLVGVTAGSEVLTSEDGFAALTYNYYTQGVDSPSWTWGASAGVRREDDAGLFGRRDEIKTKALFGIHFGYQF